MSPRRANPGWARRVRLIRLVGADVVAATRRTLEAMAGGVEHTLDPHLRALFL